jgi:hypothetical protein
MVSQIQLVLVLDNPKIGFSLLKKDVTQQNHNFRHFRSFLILAHLSETQVGFPQDLILQQLFARTFRNDFAG